MVIHEHEHTVGRSHIGLEALGLTNLGQQLWNLTAPALYERAIRTREATLAHLGPLVCRTGSHTGRSPNDKFVVKEPTSEANIWWGTVNKPFSEENFEHIFKRMRSYLENQDVYIQDCYVGADPKYRLPLRVVTQRAWHSLFARTMFIRPSREELNSHVPEFTIIDVPAFTANPEEDGTNSGTFILLNIARRLVLIGGTEYAGEIKKSAFTLMNYLMPLRGVMSMHCSANYGATKDDAAVFFGLSGTGKTTLSADPKRTLIGDDEHGWSDDGIFNYEGGCYAKVIRLSPTGEPEIYQTTRRFGTILENVTIDAETRRLDLNDDSLTENTRAAYPISHISNADLSGMCGHPKHVIFLTADAFGVLPPIAKLTHEQAMYHFISGYTAKVAGTERGVSEPQATFSTCFGAPFMALHPMVYAELLREKLRKHGSQVWLINTGWTGGAYGVGSRMKLEYTRAMITAVLEGALANVPTHADPIFGLHIPESVPNVPSELLNPRNTWADPAAYDAAALDLARRFHANFEKYADRATDEVKIAAPVAK
ncbi:MAG: phosphoenolpyruvate carboxykinase [Chloroflexi bacterium CFX4]|nr:phosphoenolpyruvate carboxykinase [Chloroflexi bacterium CFX4]MDL1922340.1 phosphoenolpyruvate carboxykinase [Chloroflexi bacterium CFX3]